MTIQVVSDQDVPAQVLVEWALKRLGDEDISSIHDIGPFRAFGVIKDGRAVCVVIWNTYRNMRFGSDMRVIIASENPKWCLPGVLRQLFSYPFEQAGCARITAVIRDGNERSLKLCRGLGFRREGVVRRGFNGKSNAIVLGMLKEECTWLLSPEERRLANGKKRPKAAAAARSAENHSGAGRRKPRGSNAVRVSERSGHLRPNGADDVWTA